MDAGTFENWQAGELPGGGAITPISSGSMEFWQAGELPPSFTFGASVTPPAAKTRTFIVMC